MGCGSSFSVLPSIKNGKSVKTSIIANTSTNKSSKLPPINSQQKSIREKEERAKNLEPFNVPSSVCISI